MMRSVFRTFSFLSAMGLCMTAVLLARSFDAGNIPELPSLKTEGRYALVKETKLLEIPGTSDQKTIEIMAGGLTEESRFQQGVWPVDLLSALAVLTVVSGFMMWRFSVQRSHIRALEQEIIERQQAEEQLHSTQAELLKRARRQALGAMAAGVAHDVNNALSPALWLSEMLVSDESLSTKQKGWCEIVKRGVIDAADIITRMSPLYRRTDEQHEQVDIGTVVSEVVKVMEIHLQQHQSIKSVRFEIDAPKTELFCSASEIRELLTNLVNNAVDSIEQSGTVRASCQAGQGDVILTVADDGCGMDEEVRSRCMESFYSTKLEYGTGLGLAATRMVVASYGGRLTVESEPEKGSTFIVTLPQSDEESQELITNDEIDT